MGVRMCLCELENLRFFVAFKLLTFPMERCDPEAFWHFLDHSTIWLEAHHSLRFLRGMWKRVVAVYVQRHEAQRKKRDKTWGRNTLISAWTLPSHNIYIQMLTPKLVYVMISYTVWTSFNSELECSHECAECKTEKQMILFGKLIQYVHSACVH